MSIYANDGDFLPRLGLDRTVADAMAVWCEQSFPAQGRRKAIAMHFDISLDEARTLIEARPSRTLLDRIYKHPNGGWRVIIPVMGAVVGQTADAFIIEEKRKRDEQRQQEEARDQRLLEMARDLRSVADLDLRRRA